MRRPKTPLSAALATALSLGFPAEGAVEKPASDLAELSLEQLASLVVTSPSRRPERLLEAPASVFVITADDIRRSGATSLPEALRLAPTLQVARADTSQYAISARGLNTTIANNMLVLIDGRTVYTPLFSGVFWDAQNLVIEDVERIEVISGPGALLWGSNGVNGVINVTTRPASATQGMLTAPGAGNREAGVVARHGGALGAGHYRAYGKYFDRDAQRRIDGSPNHDDAQGAQVGFRFDLPRGDGGHTIQGDAYQGDIGNPSGLRKISGGNLLGRWVTAPAAGGTLRVQAYLDHTRRDHSGTFRESLDIVDLDFQHALAPTKHRIVWGAGYRAARDRVENSAALAFIPADRTLRWSNLYVQDEVALRSDLRLTLGARVEENTYTGTEFLPNVRLAWHSGPQQLVWSQVSRTVRAPSRLDRDLFAPGQPPFLIVGNTTLAAEVANVVEVGYRAELAPNALCSITAFHHDRDRLRSVEPLGTARVLANGIEGRTSGVEGWVDWRVFHELRLLGGFLLLDQELRVKPGHVDMGGLPALGNDPRRQFVARASWDAAKDVEVDVAARHVGALPNPSVPSYTAVDGRVGWKVSRTLELSLTAQNLLDRSHGEWGAPATRVEYGRSFFVKLVWRI
jgi:iron complex outermembrane recepter protein